MLLRMSEKRMTGYRSLGYDLRRDPLHEVNERVGAKLREALKLDRCEDESSL